MAYTERTNQRASGFSHWMRTLYQDRGPLEDVTRHIDGDWTWFCGLGMDAEDDADACCEPLYLIEDKFQSHSLYPRQWRGTRKKADRMSIPALGIGWFNETKNRQAAPTQAIISIWYAGRRRALLTGIGHVGPLLADATVRHYRHCHPEIALPGPLLDIARWAAVTL